MRRVYDLGVELDAVDPALGSLEGGDRRGGRAGRDARAFRRSRHGIAVAHPAGLLLRQAGEQRAVRLDANLGLAELRDAGPLDRPAELLRHQLHAVADAERRHAELENAGVDARRAVGVHGGGTA